MLRRFVSLLILTLAASSWAQLAKLKPEDLLSARGIEIGPTVCGASGSDPELQLQSHAEMIRRVDRRKWAARFRRAKNVMQGYEKYASRCTINLPDGRRLLVSDQGFICVRTKDPKVFYYFQLDPKDFAEIKKEWNAIL